LATAFCSTKYHSTAQDQLLSQCIAPNAAKRKGYSSEAPADAVLFQQGTKHAAAALILGVEGALQVLWPLFTSYAAAASACGPLQLLC
jgi:hypothetical protein